MANKENLRKLQSFISNLGVDLGEALMMIVAVFNWQWADSKSSEDLKCMGIPDDKLEMVIDFFRCNYRTRYKIISPVWHKKLLANTKEYQKDYEYECKLNQGKPWEIRIQN